MYSCVYLYSYLRLPTDVETYSVAVSFVASFAIFVEQQTRSGRNSYNYVRQQETRRKEHKPDTYNKILNLNLERSCRHHRKMRRRSRVVTDVKVCKT